jgi:hypothetical protein
MLVLSNKGGDNRPNGLAIGLRHTVVPTRESRLYIRSLTENIPPEQPTLQAHRHGDTDMWHLRSSDVSDYRPKSRIPKVPEY